MKTKLVLIFSILIVIGCNSSKKSMDSNIMDESLFVEVINNNKMKSIADTQETADKHYIIKVPKSIKTTTSISGGSFIRIMEFENQQQIITVYEPSSELKIDKELLNVSYKKYKSTTDKLNLYDLEDVKLLKNRRFGVQLLDNHFIIMYLNIKKENVKYYNYSITTLVFKN